MTLINYSQTIFVDLFIKISLKILKKFENKFKSDLVNYKI